MDHALKVLFVYLSNAIITHPDIELLLVVLCTRRPKLLNVSEVDKVLVADRVEVVGHVVIGPRM